MSLFTLAFSCLSTSNLPWFMDLTFQVPMQYCSLRHWTLLLSLVWSTTGCCFSFDSIPSFFLELFLHWSPVSHWAPTDLGSPSFSVLSFCPSYCSWGSQGKNTEVVCHSLLQYTTFCQTSPPWPDHLGWPYTAWLRFIELDKAMVHVIRLVSCLWLWFQSVCPLMPSLRAYRLTWVSLTLDMGYLYTAAPVKHSCCSLPLMWGISPWPQLLTLDVGYLLSLLFCHAASSPVPHSRLRSNS